MCNDPLGEVHILVLRASATRLPGPFRMASRSWTMSRVQRRKSSSNLSSSTGGSRMSAHSRALEPTLCLGYETAIGSSRSPTSGQRTRSGCRATVRGHYPVIARDFRRKGLNRPRFAKLLERASAWGLPGVVLAPSREGLPELYERSGALPVGRLKPIRGTRRMLRRFVNPHRPLAHRATEILREHGAGMRAAPGPTR